MKAITLLTLACLLTACGGGSGGTPEPEPPPPPVADDPPPPPPSAAGIWRGTVSNTATGASGQGKAGTDFEEDVVCLVDGTELVCWVLDRVGTIWPPPGNPPTGDPAIQEVGDLLAVMHGQIAIDDASVPSGDGTWFANDLNHHCCLLPDNTIVNTFTIDGGLVQPGASANLDITIGGFPYTLDAPYDEGYEAGHTLESISRVYGETVISAPFGGPHSFGSWGQEGDNLVHYIATQGLVVDPDGSFFLQYDVGGLSCAHNGVIGSGDGVNLHAITMTVAGNGCLGVEGSYSGLGYIDGNGALVLAVFDDSQWIAVKAAP